MDSGAEIAVYGNKNLPEGTADRPLVTFAVFAYNQEKYIREAVEGAFAQTYSPLEIILSDDCSSDRTFEIIAEMAKAYRGPHKVVINRNVVNLGVLGHVRRTTELARGRFVVMAAGDDISYPERSRTLVEAWKSGANAICSSCELIDGSGKVVQRYWEPKDDSHSRLHWVKEISSSVFVYGASSAYDRSILEKLPASELPVMSEDAPLNFIAQLEDCKIMRIAKPLVKYRIHAESISKSSVVKPAWSAVEVAEKARPNEIKRLINILSYMKEIVAQNQKYADRIDVAQLDERLAFSHLQLDWYKASDISYRLRVLREAPSQYKHWFLCRTFGPRFYIFLKLISLKVKRALRPEQAKG
ncbi:glycosyltransferase [Wenzhouxiangella marina]|uniref:glycosyltransferase n=1 Tax=Wenzhouxiangella marina TaxID=1579979 RepID=UPI0009E23F1F|nr:glycosyltransferase [Wenzhouxiangella marina]MBB6087566.1 glycosyltransferase involved in cell wall biosynthesis [Wenzhouxiangella marina]